MTHYTVDDLGIAGYGAQNLDWDFGSIAIHPESGAEVALHPAFEYGFVVIDPRARTGVHITPEDPLFILTGRGAVQAADGMIYLAGCRKDPATGEHAWHLLQWDWRSPGLRPVATCPPGFTWYHKPESSPDGGLYLGDSGGVPLHRYDIAGKTFTAMANVSNGFCAADGFFYFREGGGIVSLDPASSARKPVLTEDGQPCPAGELKRDAAGRVVVMTVVEERDGIAYWLELIGGKTAPVDANAVRITRTVIGNSEIAFSEPYMTMTTPYVFRDGSYLSRIIGDEITCVSPLGRAQTFTMQRTQMPLRLYSLEACAGRIWLGAVLPLTLLSYDPATSAFTNHGNPTPAGGEIYNMVESRDRLYFASYPQSFVTRYDPARNWRLDRGVQANPAQFGRMKDEGAPVYRIHGRAKDPAGNVYFASFGDYGCEDSAICRIDIATEAMTRWIYPSTSLSGMTYLPQIDQLLLCENRKGEEGIRFTFVSPVTGEVLSSEVMIEDHGMITSWLHDGGDWVYGLHDYRATLFAYSLRERKIVQSLPELGFGHHCKNCLLFGPDGRIWGQTHECIFAVDRALTAKERVADYPDHTNVFATDHSRFGFIYGPDGHLYFLNGRHLMRVRVGEHHTSHQISEE